MTITAAMSACPAYVEAHLSRLYATAIEAEVPAWVIVSVPNGQNYWRSESFPLAELEEAARYCSAQSDLGRNVFVRCTLLTERVERNKRGTNEQTGWAVGMAADVDIAGPGHKDPADGLPLPPDVDVALALVDGFLPPSYIVHSGGGLYPWWLTDEVVDLRDPTAAAEWTELSRQFGASLATAGARLGFHVDKVHDKARVLRPAGVINHKPNRDARPVTVHRGWIMGAGRYSLDDLRSAILPEARVEVAPKTRILRSADEVTSCDVFESIYTLKDVLQADARFGPWTCIDDKGGWDKWVRAGTDADYSIKQNQQTGTIIVWSSRVAAHLDVDPGSGLDLFGFACRLEGRDAKTVAAELMREANRRIGAVA